MCLLLQEIKNSQEQEFLQERKEDEMEMSDSEDKQDGAEIEAGPAIKRQKLQEQAQQHSMYRDILVP